MAKRERSRSVNSLGGTTWHPSDPDGTRTSIFYKPFEIETIDYVKKLKRPDGSLPPSFFESNKVTRIPATISRKSPTTWNFASREIYESYTANTNGRYPLPGSWEREADNQFLATELVARTHPFTPYFSVPVAIKELLEVSSLFKLAAKSFASYVGGAYLNYRFGWLQFHNDLKTLNDLTKDLEVRLLDFNRLLKQGNTRKHAKLGEVKDRTSSSDVVFHSAYGVSISGDVKRNYSLETWGSVTWGVLGEKLFPTDQLALFNRALTAALDLEDIDPPTLWEMVPFSWLADYFVNFGAVLHATHMRYELQPYDICIMRHFVNDTVTIPKDYPSSVSVSGNGKYIREIKTRDVVHPTFRPTFYFDLLRGDRWAVILSLLAKFHR